MKFTIYKRKDGKWKYMESGNLFAPLQKGRRVEVGSISSRTGLSTSPLKEMVRFSSGVVIFMTMNSLYKLEPIR